VLELQSLRYQVIGCFGPPEVLDSVGDDTNLRVRVAPDELLLIGAQVVLNGDWGGVAVDLSSGYAVWMLRGPERREVLRRLSAIELPATGTVQGLVAHVPAKIIVREDDLVILVSSVVSHHLRHRALCVSADLNIVERAPAVRESRQLV
jgi:hypothetical protein